MGWAMRTIRRTLLWGLCTFCGLAGSSRAESSLQVQISSPKSEYIVGEPIKISIALVNAGTERLRIAETSLLDFQSEYLYLEVALKNGALEERRFDYYCEIGIANPAYEGEPLRPGARLETALFPNLTRNRNRANSWRRTFDRPGVYEVSVVYEVPEVMTALGASVRKAKSNTISLSFRAPSADEREILETLWSDGGASLSLGDREIHCLWDRSELANVLTRYSDHPMTSYVRFALAKALLVTYQRSYQEDAVDVLRTLARSSPDFRPEEVGLWTAVAMYYSGEQTAASAEFAALVRKYPSLRMTPAFVRYRVLSEYGDLAEYRIWRTERREGIDRYAPKEE